MFQFLFYNDQLVVTFKVIRRIHVKQKYFARSTRSARRNIFHSSGQGLNPLPTGAPLQGFFKFSASAFAFALFHSSLFTKFPAANSR